MFKLMHKKLNKKGFTLAELLIVVAIIAILVAIAIPVFTQAMIRAQIRTNDANIRSTKAAAISEILDNWDKFKVGNVETGTGDEYIPGWFAVGHVMPDGKLAQVNVYVPNAKVTGEVGPAIGYVDKEMSAVITALRATADEIKAKFPNDLAGSDDWVLKTDEDYSTTSPTGTTNGYYTLVYIDDVEDKTS